MSSRFKVVSNDMDKYNYKISIIIPAYNVESFIECCLSSILRQVDCVDYEIIVVNDGSTDSTMEKIQKFICCNNPPNLRVFSTKNQGLSATRNFGLKLSKGEYIWFVDSDDWITANSLAIILAKLNENDLDVIALNAIINKDDEVYPVIRNLKGDKIYNGAEVFSKSWKYPYSGAQFYIFKHSFLIKESLLFENGIYFEDLLFTPVALDKCRSIGVCEIPVYNYRLRSNSITTSNVSLKKANDLIYIMECFISKIQINNYYNIEIFNKVIFSIMTMLIRKYINHLPPEQSTYIRCRINKNKNLRHLVLWKTWQIKYKFVYLLAKYFPNLCGI